MAVKKKPAKKKAVKKKAAKKKSVKSKKSTGRGGNPSPNPSTKFQPGVSGNPAGRPKGKKTFTSVLRDLMASSDLKLEITTKKPNDELPEVKTFEIKTDKNMYYAVSMTLIHEALKGDIFAINTILDRLDGKPVQANLIVNENDFKDLSLAEKQEKLAAILASRNTGS